MKLLPSDRLGSTARTMKDDAAYQNYKKQRGERCDFCFVAQSASEVVADYPLFHILTNAFPYAIWDGGRVTDHIMLVPKRHVDSVAHFTAAEQAEFTTILAQYEEKGYSFYGRGNGSNYKSIPHQHTHLMKLGKKITSHFFAGKVNINYYR